MGTGVLHSRESEKESTATACMSTWPALRACSSSNPLALISPIPKPQQSTESKTKQRSAALPLKRAIWEYCCDAGWITFCFSLFFFLSAQASRQVGTGVLRVQLWRRPCCKVPAAAAWLAAYTTSYMRACP